MGCRSDGVFIILILSICNCFDCVYSAMLLCKTQNKLLRKYCKLA